MLSIFAVPKPFRGHIGVIQRNAIGSWRQLQPQCEIFLFGDEEGTADVAKEFGVYHVPNIARNEFGTPLLSDVFKKGERLATYQVHCYFNCDIILGRQLMFAVKQVSERRRRFLVMGECRNLDVGEPIAFDRATWEDDLKVLADKYGEARGLMAIDYFVFSRGLYQALPPFALGRAGFDNWLLWKARNLGAAVVDATQVITAIHQNHGYSHVAGGRDYALHGEEAMRNLQYIGGWTHIYAISHATHRLLPTGIRRNWNAHLLPGSRVIKMKAQARAAFWLLMELTRPVRHAFGLNAKNWRKLRNVLFGEKRFYLQGFRRLTGTHGRDRDHSRT